MRTSTFAATTETFAAPGIPCEADVAQLCHGNPTPAVLTGKDGGASVLLVQGMGDANKTEGESRVVSTVEDGERRTKTDEDGEDSLRSLLRLGIEGDEHVVVGPEVASSGRLDRAGSDTFDL